MHDLPWIVPYEELSLQSPETKTWEFRCLFLTVLCIWKVYEHILKLTRHGIINPYVDLCKNHNKVKVSIEISINSINFVLWVSSLPVLDNWIVVKHKPFSSDNKLIVFWNTTHWAYKEWTTFSWNSLNHLKLSYIPYSNIALVINWHCVRWVFDELTGNNSICMSFQSTLKRPSYRYLRLPHFYMRLEATCENIPTELIGISNTPDTSLLLLSRFNHFIH